MNVRPLYAIAHDIAATWPTPSPHAKTYLKAMHYLVDIDDVFVAGHARRIVRFFLLYSKEWQGAAAERIRAELSEISRQPRANKHILPVAKTPALCELCGIPIQDKYVYGHSVWHVLAKMCPACHFNLGVGFAKGDGALYQLESGGCWRHLHGSCPAAIVVPSASPFSGTVPLIARAKRGRIVRAIAPALRKMLKTLGGWSARLRGRAA
jgi:hypothetical protein